MVEAEPRALTAVMVKMAARDKARVKCAAFGVIGKVKASSSSLRGKMMVE